MSRRLWISVVVVVVLVLAAGIPTGLVLHQHQQQKAQRVAAQDFAHAWEGGRLAGLSYANGQGATIAAQVQKITRALTPAATDSPAHVTAGAVSKVSGDKNEVTAPLQVSWTLAGGRVWSYASTLTLVKTGSAWLPAFSPSLIHPDLTTGAVLQTVSRQPQRGEIIGANNDVLVTERPVVTVGLERSRTSDVSSSVAEVAAITKVDGGALLKRVNAASASAFVQVITLRQDAYEKVRDQLQPIPGAVFQQGTLSLGPSADFARSLIGTVGTASADVIKQSQGRIQIGDVAGLSGLQRSYDAQLAGTPGRQVQLVPAAKGATPKTLFDVPPVNGKPLKISLDRQIQLDAQAALTKAKKPAALVAIRVGTGEVLAVGNGGPGGDTGYDRALIGQYPPGSTFKVASTLALLGVGVTPKSTVKCPATINVGGRTFKNAEAEKLGAVSFALDFANSCNTAFIGSSPKITSAQLAKAAHTLGYGQPDQLGVTAFTGQVPSSGDAVAHAAAMIGQGTVLTSPVTVAGSSAAVAAGRWSPPRLVLQGSAPPAGPQIPAASDAALKQLMRDVVTEGTGTGLKNVAGGPVSGKTGTAEFGNDNPPQTHAWFTGFQGDVAFAVVVEGGGFGAKAAVPIVKDFLTRLNSQ